jgi:hypothetical protein
MECGRRHEKSRPFREWVGDFFRSSHHASALDRIHLRAIHPRTLRAARRLSPGRAHMDVLISNALSAVLFTYLSGLFFSLLERWILEREGTV